jgi:hypothetical protein
MSECPQEKPAVKTTIVGGRPPGCGKETENIPRGIEVLIKKASVDEAFRKILLVDRERAADKLGLFLTAAEETMLRVISESMLDKMIKTTKVHPNIRPAFMGYAAAVMLAALTASVEVKAEKFFDSRSGGISPDYSWRDKPKPKPETPSEESYIFIAGGDKDLPTGTIVVRAENKSSKMWVHFFKIQEDSVTVVEKTEGVGYLRGGTYSCENIPEGQYVVEIGTGLGSYDQQKSISVQAHQTTSATF